MHAWSAFPSTDSDLDIARRKRLLELQRQLMEKKQPKPEKPEEATVSPRQVLVRLLVGRGIEVLEAAERQFPKVLQSLESQLASLIQSGELKGPITGEQLHWFLRQVGLRVRIQTQIRFSESGELKSVQQKLKEA